MHKWSILEESVSLHEDVLGVKELWRDRDPHQVILNTIGDSN